MSPPSLERRLLAEFLGTLLLLVAVVGSGIMGERLAQGNDALALLANAIATGGALIALILTFAPISGAHFNPAVTLAFVAYRQLTVREGAAYILVQVLGAILGVWLAHLMFSLPLWQLSGHDRGGAPLFVSEIVATFGLLAVILSGFFSRSTATPYAVAAYITGAYWFTSSTSFANPAVTLARSLTDTFAGIEGSDAPGFIAAQLLGAGLALACFRWFYGVGKPA